MTWDVSLSRNTPQDAFSIFTAELGLSWAELMISLREHAQGPIDR